jgi:hypothetical protein
MNDEERGPLWIPIVLLLLIMGGMGAAGYLAARLPSPPKVPVPHPRLEGTIVGAGVPIRICRTPAPTRYVAADSARPPCTPMASLYSDKDMKIPLANPVYTDWEGKFDFYAEPGYYRFEVGTK